MKPLRIIAVVDDDPDDLELISEAFLLADKDLDIRGFNSGKQLFDFLCSAPKDFLPSLFIIDYNIPDQNGPEIIDMLQSHPQYLAIPKVILSTSDSHMYQRICREKGANYYFKKPSNFEKWIRMAGEILRS